MLKGRPYCDREHSVSPYETAHSYWYETARLSGVSHDSPYSHRRSFGDNAFNDGLLYTKIESALYLTWAYAATGNLFNDYFAQYHNDLQLEQVSHVLN